MKLPVAILAGGLATRLRPITQTIPKSLLPVAGKPFIEHQLALLSENGLDQVIICVGHLGEKIRDTIQDGSRLGLKVEYSFDGPLQLGTAGALKKAIPLLGETFFVLYGDSYLEIDYQKVQAAFRQSKKLSLMTVYRNEGQWDRSNVLLKEGKIIRYDKKNPEQGMRHIDYGLGILTAEALSLVPDNKPYDISEVYSQLAARGRLAALEVTRRFYEIGSPEGLKETEQYLSR
ncbi:UTP--glucose-1-phosphate uridylyltransferase [subsurface metagenome]